MTIEFEELSESLIDAFDDPDDERSDSMNPNNPAYQASMDNRSNQINPNNPAYWSSRGGSRGGRGRR